MKIKQKNKKGISLIVLVITIIVMIILAAAIILSLNSNGIIGKANKATTDSDKANLLEAATIAAAEWNLEYKLGETTDDAKTYITEKLEAQNFTAEQIAKLGITETGEVSILTYTMYSDGTDEAPIPDGFSVSSVSTERTIENGLVIIDEDGNEFVWVPVDDINLFKRTRTYDGTITDPGSNFTEPYTAGYATEVAEYNSMYNSVKEHKGFYIGRYEAGKEESDKVSIKKDITTWNNIIWGDSNEDVGTNGAVYYSRKMYEGSSSVSSTLCYGVQWDAALQFIAKKDSDYPNNSTEKGNYTGNIEKTGHYAANNIYDMSGNVWEWTMESYNSGRVFRGCDYYYDDYNYPASFRTSTIPNDTDGPIYYFGFRPTLYIK